MKLLLKIMYDGTNYFGYQAQANLPSVQGTLTRAVSECFGFPCTVTGCSRTDTGVHALGFCAVTEPIEEKNVIPIPTGKVHRALRRYLPDDISVCGEAEVSSDFHPRYSVLSKEYLYRMYDTVYDDPFMNNRAWHLKHPITDTGIARMNAAAGYLIGRHDFTSFMASGSKITDANRTVHSLNVCRNGSNIELRVSADGFLYNMVRIITGTLVECAAGTFEPGDIPKILEKKNRSAAGRTAPPHGLYLANVCYDREINWVID